ncbi:MAG: hypothetical protein KC422_25090 [Trueperaceae bacterium]|nr:hypothetical protein [Trueperaceae bacterium]
MPAIAFSAPQKQTLELDYETLKPFIKQVITNFLVEQLCMLINVNLPLKPTNIVWTRQSVRHYEGHVVEGKDPMGRQHYWFAAQPIEAVEKGTDR